MTGKKVIGLFLSLRTTVWLLCVLVVLLLAGSFVMPVKEEFQSVNSMPLLKWILEQPVSVTWWLWCSVGILCFLSANTIFCSIESVMTKKKISQWLLIISPQVIHMGFLFMLLAHLLSSLGGFKSFEVAMEGTLLNMPDNEVLQVKNINILLDPYGYVNDWTVDLEYQVNGKTIKEERLMPNKPLFHRGTGVYVKDLRAFPNRAILVEMSREPGASWALIGGILFMTGNITLLILKMKRDYPLLP